MINLSVSTTFIPDGQPLHQALKLCEEAGIQSVEIGSNHCYEENYNYLSDFSFQYLFHNYFPIPRDSFVVNIASLDENIRFRSISHIKTAIDFCHEHDGHLYTFHPGFLTDSKGPNRSNQNYDFHWDQSKIEKSNYEKSVNKMYAAFDEIILYAKLKKVKIAIETEGSLSNHNHLLMQKPIEYQKFIEKYYPRDIGINLNIGHLNLSAKAFCFKQEEFIDLIQNYIVAMELSHNNGVEDQHQPLQRDGWYWELIHDTRFEGVYKILEFRNTPISEIVKNIYMIQEKAHAVSVSG